MTSPSIPVFITQGCDVLTSTMSMAMLNGGINSENEILRNFGGSGVKMLESITPELLRRVKFGLCEDEEDNLVQQLHESLSSNSYTDPAHTIWDLGSCSIQEQLWTQQIVDNIHEATSVKCHHVVASKELLTGSYHSKTLHIGNSSIDVGNHELISDPTILNALLMKYGVILNKLKKVQQLEESNAKLANEIFVLAKDGVDFPLQSRFFSNILDGVELVMPVCLKDQKPNKRSTSKKSLKYTNASEVLHEELKLLGSNTASIESYKQNEEQFWKWMGACKLSHELQERRNNSSAISSPLELELRRAFTPIITRLNGYLTDLEEAVLAVLLNNKKVSARQLASILAYHNANFAEKFKDHLTIVPTITASLCGDSSFLLAQLLQLPPKAVEVTFSNEVMELRNKHRILMKKLIDDFSPHSPFRPIVK